MPEISVIVPVYKVEPYLRRCVDSILTQTFTDFELILVDDGSPDGCPAICDEYAEKDSRVHVIHQENGGLSAARNAGIDWAFENSDSRWLAFVDSDDWIDSIMIEALFKAAQAHAVDISICDYYVASKYRISGDTVLPTAEKVETEVAYAKRGGLFDIAWGKLFKRDLFLKIRFPQGCLFEDAWTTYRVIFQSSAVAMLSSKLYGYYSNEESITHSEWKPNWLTEIEAHEEQLKFFFENHYFVALKEAISCYFWVLQKQYIAMRQSNVNTAQYEKAVLKKMRIALRKCGAQLEGTPGYRGIWEFCHPKCSSFFGALRSLRQRVRKLKKLAIQRKSYANFKKKLRLKHTQSEDEAIQLMKACHDSKKGSFSQKTQIHFNYDLMVIVPVYNAEKYLKECVESILTQKTQYSYMVCFVDDGSTDQSGKILDEYRERSGVKVIHQENRGHSGARNRALESIEGRYIMFVDADDYIANDAVQILMDEALKHSADIVEGGITYFWDNGKSVSDIHRQSGIVQDSQNALTGYPCGKVIRSEAFKDLCFPEGIWFEDTIIKTLLYPKCSVFATVSDVVYYYRQNPSSISHTCRDNQRCVDTYWITQYYLEEMKRRGYAFDVGEYQHFLAQCRTNYLRVSQMPQEIQKSVFTLECSLHKEYFGNAVCPKGLQYNLTVDTLNQKSFAAFSYLQEHWNNFE